MSQKELKGQIMSGMVWKFAERFVTQGVSFVVSLVLAWMLVPDDYGVVAVINIFITIADVFLTSGLNTALIQKQDADELDFSTIFYINLGMGVVLYLILYITAPVMAELYSMPILTSAVRIFAIRLPISSFQSIQTAYISKKMDFKKFFFSTLFGTIVSAVVGIWMAKAGYGVWALIAQYLSNTVIDTLVLFVTVRWHPKLIFSWERAKPLISYGSKVAATDLIGTIFNNLGDFIVGAKYTSADLGYYTKGKQLPTMLKTNVTMALISVLFPGMSKVNDMAEKIKEISRRSVKVLSYIIFPIMLGLLIVARTLTIVLYSAKWEPMVPFVWVVCVEAILSVPGTIALQAVKAYGRSDLMLKVEFIKKPILLISTLIAVRMGVLAIAIVLPINTFIELIINGILAQKTVKYKLSELVFDCMPALVLSFIMCLAVYGISLLPISNIVIKLILQIIVGGGVYLFASFVSKNSEFKMLLDIVLKRKSK